jgi:predicted nucleotidyltransferase
MARSGKKALDAGLPVKNKTSAAQKTPAAAALTDGYQILDALSINKKIPFEELLKIITESIVERIGKAHVRNIYVFGSHAWGRPNKYSDIDLCVVIANRLNKNNAYFNISKELNSKKIVSLDILVYNEREYNDRKNRAGIVNTIVTKGRALYG